MVVVVDFCFFFVFRNAGGHYFKTLFHDRPSVAVFLDISSFAWFISTRPHSSAGHNFSRSVVEFEFNVKVAIITPLKLGTVTNSEVDHAEWHLWILRRQRYLISLTPCTALRSFGKKTAQKKIRWRKYSKKRMERGKEQDSAPKRERQQNKDHSRTIVTSGTRPMRMPD